MNTFNSLLTLRQVAEHLGLSTRTVRNRIYEGVLKAGKDGNRIRIRKSELEHYIQTQVMR